MNTKIQLCRDEPDSGGFEMEPDLFSFKEFKMQQRLGSDQCMYQNPCINNDINTFHAGNDLCDGSFEVVGCARIK